MFRRDVRNPASTNFQNSTNTRGFLAQTRKNHEADFESPSSAIPTHYTFSAPVTDAQRQRDTLLGALVGLARSTVNEPKTEDTDRILAAGLRLAAGPEAAESALLRMTDIVEAEKHRVAPNCAACAMPCGNTSNYDLARLWGAPAEICALKVRLLFCVCVLAGQKTTAQIQKEICDDLFVLAEDWDTELLLPIVTRAEGLCVQ